MYGQAVPEPAEEQFKMNLVKVTTWRNSSVNEIWPWTTTKTIFPLFQIRGFIKTFILKVTDCDSKSERRLNVLMSERILDKMPFFWKKIWNFKLVMKMLVADVYAKQSIYQFGLLFFYHSFSYLYRCVFLKIIR